MDPGYIYASSFFFQKSWNFEQRWTWILARDEIINFGMTENSSRNLWISITERGSRWTSGSGRERRRRASGCLEFYYTRPVSPFLIDRIEAIRGSSLLAYGNNPLDSIVRWSEKAWSRGRGRGYGRISCVTGPRKGATYGSQIWPGILPNIDRV